MRTLDTKRSGVLRLTRLLAMAVVVLLLVPTVVSRCQGSAAATPRDQPAPARDMQDGRLGRWRMGVGRLWAASLPWFWFVILGWVIGIYFITYFLLPRLPLGPSGRLYIVQPTLWFSLALVSLLFWHRGLQEKPRLFSYVVALALVAGVFHIALLVLAGVTLGFGHSPYGDSPAVVAQNMLYVGSGVLGLELARASLVAVFARRSSFVALAFVSLILALVIIPKARFMDLGSTETGFETFGETFLPGLSESLLASFLALTGGPLASIAYRGGLEAFRWFSPILPDLSWGVTAFVGTLAPAMVLLIVRGLTVSAPAEEARREGRRASWTLFPLGVALVAVGLLWFSTGLLGVRPSLVAGQSMEPTLRAGDVVVTREVSPEDIAVGDIVRYANGSTTILHRVIEIYDSGTTRWVVTKGDANDAADSPITADQIEGEVVAVIPKIGWVGIHVKNALGSLLVHAQGGGGSHPVWTKTLTTSLSVTTATSFEPLAVIVDIKPGSDPNSINLSCQGVIPVAILTTGDFDAATVHSGSVIFAGAAALHSALEDVDGDEDIDLILQFDCQQVSIASDATQACLRGTTYEGVAIEGCDSVRIAGVGSPAVAPVVAMPAPAPPSAASAGAPTRTPTTEYEVQPGDTLIDIAARFGTSVEALVELNGLQDPSLISYGSTLNVPYAGEHAGDASAGVSPQSRWASVGRGGH